jgi:membrane fusion protein (multidrug efflux system)
MSRSSSLRYLFSVLLVALLMLSSCAKKEPVDTEQTVSYSADVVASATDYTQVVASAVPIEERPLRDRVIGSGTVQGQQEVSIKARTSGEIRSVHGNLGSTLNKGDVLIILDDTIANLNLSQLENQYKNAQGELAVNEQLYAKGAISLSQLNQNRSSADGLAAQLENARNARSNTQITTPISGSIAELTKLVPGDLISAGAQVARIVDLEHLRVTLGVGQNQLFLIKEGARAEIVIETPIERITAEGRVSAVGASSDSRTGSWTVYVDFDNPRLDILKAGITASVTIYQDDAPRYQLVPNQAMVYRNAKTYVFLAEGGSASLVEVRIVDQYGDFTAIESVDANTKLTGKRVLVSGLSRLVDGSSISIQ